MIKKYIKVPVPKGKKFEYITVSVPKVKKFVLQKSRRRMLSTTPALPDSNRPFVTGIMTREEIQAIPKDRYIVTELRTLTRTCSLSPEKRRKERMVVAIELVNKAQEGLLLLHKEMTNPSTIDYGGPEPPSNIFVPPIRESNMADCIFGVMTHFFRGKDKYVICHREYSRMDFCVLMHIYFKYIKIMNNQSRLSYSSFLQKNVFGDNISFGERTYNTYANKDVFLALEKELTKLKVDFKHHPKLPPEPNENILKPAFQEIGCAFQNSDYFIHLRKLRENLENI